MSKKSLKTDELGFVVKGQTRKVDKLAFNIGRELPPIEFLSDDELQAIPPGEIFVFDVETYANFWCVAFKHLSSGKFVIFEESLDTDFNATKLRWMLWRFCLVGFNSISYDIPIIEYALSGATGEKLKEASDFIIKSPVRITPYVFEQTYKIKIGRYNHIDLFNVCPVNGNNGENPSSLKLYAGRLHCQRMQDLPFPEYHILTQQDAVLVRSYCCNDLSNTELLFKALANEIKLRIDMSEQFNVDLRSKSDAQIAESVINKELEKVLGYYPKRPDFKEDSPPLRYSVPDFIYFQTPQLQSMFEVMRSAEFYLDGRGSPVMPTEVADLTVRLGKATYTLGIGGLHSTEKISAHEASDEIILADNDVESFYPRTILNQKLYPPHLGEAFLTVYESIVQTRIRAKAAAKSGDKSAQVIADSLKITINGSFGKLGNRWSTLYAPQLMLQVTITGQLVLLMLIEALELMGIECISGNTDGVISKYHVSRHSEVRALIQAWEAHTGYRTEETRYRAVYSRDVNSYVAVKFKGDKDSTFFDERLGCKTKGAYCERGSALNSVLSKNPEALICIDAALCYIATGKSVESTIRECRDFQRFVTVRNVKGGAEKGGIYLGKVVRWYYAIGEAGFIAYAESGNKVAKTDNAKPVMDLPASFPDDIDYDWYVKAAIELLYDCGKLKRVTTGLLPF